MKTLTLGVLISAVLSLHSGASAIDLGHLDYDAEINALISRHMPAALASSLDSMFSPEAIPSFIEVVCYRQSDQDTSCMVLLVHMTDAHSHSALQMYTRTSEGWALESELRDVAGSSVTTIDFLDLDCDGDNEIMLTSPVGSAANQWIDLIDIIDDSLANITRLLFGSELSGRRVIFQKHSNCDWEVEVLEDGNEKFVVSRRMLYRLDNTAMKFQKVLDEQGPESRR